MAPSYGIAPGDPDLHVMTGKIGSTHGNSRSSHDDSRKREAPGRRDLQHYFFLPGFADGEVERRNPEGGEKLFHRILGGDDGDDRSGCFRCTPVAVENVHVSVSPFSAPQVGAGPAPTPASAAVGERAGPPTLAAGANRRAWV